MTKPDQYNLNLARRALARARQEAFEKGRIPLSKKQLRWSRGPLFTADTKSGMRRVDVEEDPQNLLSADGKPRADVGVGLPADAGRAHFSRFDPHPLRLLVQNLSAAKRWDRPLLGGRIEAEWEQIVGEAIANHCQVVEFEDGELSVVTDTSAWAQQLRLFIPQIMKKLEDRYGADVVTKLSVRGPAQRSWSHGPRSVPGRGPRDTYG